MVNILWYFGHIPYSQFNNKNNLSLKYFISKNIKKKKIQFQLFIKVYTLEEKDYFFVI